MRRSWVAWGLPPPPPQQPGPYLELVEVVAIFAVLHHPAKYQQASPIAHEAIGCTSRRDVPSHGRDEPLVGRWRTKVSRSQNASGAPRTRTSTPLPPHIHQPSKYGPRKEELRQCLSSQGWGTFSFYHPRASPLSKPSSKPPGLRGHLKTACGHLASRHSRLNKQEVSDRENSSASGNVATSRHSTGQRKKRLTPKIPSRGPWLHLKWPKELAVQAGRSSPRYRPGRAMGVRINLYCCFPGDGPEQPSPGPTPLPAPRSRTQAEVAAVSAS